MSKEPNAYKVKLIRGASYVIPGYRFVPGGHVVVPASIIGTLKASQKFDIKPDDGVAEAEDQDVAEDEVDDQPSAPARKPKRKRR